MIEVRELVSGYGDRTVLDGISVTIPDGDWVVLAGRNGSGKTTLVRHFNALLEPDAGEVLIDGLSAPDNPVAARTAVGMVFQNPRDGFVAATVGADVAFGPENLGLERGEIDDRVADALGAVGMTGRDAERIDALSGGERARVAVAGALAMEPSHLVLDEPFAGLDWPARQSLLDHLDGLYDRGTGVLVVTHDLRDVLPRADRVLGLRDGELAVDTGPDAARDRLEDVGVRIPEC
jgi:biotin transport system ATP-binding protein